MEKVIGSDLRDVIAIPYLDDAICFSKNFTDHIEYGTKLEPRKCKLFRKEFHFLGKVKFKEGDTVDPKSVDTVFQFRESKQGKVIKLCKLLGFLSYFRKWMTNFATQAKSLCDLRLAQKEHGQKIKNKEEKIWKHNQLASTTKTDRQKQHQTALEDLI